MSNKQRRSEVRVTYRGLAVACSLPVTATPARLAFAIGSEDQVSMDRHPVPGQISTCQDSTGSSDQPLSTNVFYRTLSVPRYVSRTVA